MQTPIKPRVLKDRKNTKLDLYLRAAAVAAVLIAASCSPARSTSPADAAANPGSSRTVCAKVADVVEDPISAGPIHLYLDRPSPDQSLVVTIQDRSTAGNLRYLGRTVCVTGQVQLGPQGPFIQVPRAAQVSVSAEPVEEIEVETVDQNRGKVVRTCGPIGSYNPDAGSDLKATVTIGNPDDPTASLRVESEDRRPLGDLAASVGRRACVTGFIRTDSSNRPWVILRDPREFSVAP
jgi:hypothetical protein